MNAERIKELRVFFGSYLSDLLADDKRAAAEDDPNGAVHPVYMGQLVGPYYRDALAVLDEVERLRERKFHCLSCDGELIPITEAQARAEKAEAALAQKTKDYDWMMAQHDAWKACAFEESKRKKKAEAELEQARVQLAGCGAAALGATKDPAKQGDYGWSASYQDVLNLQARSEKAEADLAAAQLVNSKNGAVIAEQMAELEAARGFLSVAERILTNHADLAKEYSEAINPIANAYRQKKGEKE